MTFIAGHGKICRPHGLIHMATRRPAHNKPIHMNFLFFFCMKNEEPQAMRRLGIPEGPKIKKNRDLERDWNFRARLNFSSEPPTAALFLVGEIETSRLKNFDRDSKIRSRLKISSEIDFFDRWRLGMFFDIERGKLPAIRTLVAVWPAMQVLAMPNR